MSSKTYRVLKILVIIISLLLLNLTLLSNYQHATAIYLLNTDLQPEENTFWIYELTDKKNNAIFKFELVLTEEKKMSIKNQFVDVYIQEAEIEIIKWSANKEQADQYEFHLKKWLKKDNLEVIKYTQTFDYLYLEEEENLTGYHHQEIEYDYIESTKPNNITIGSEWIIRFWENQTFEFKLPNEDPADGKDNGTINSTVKCLSLEQIPVRAGTFDTFWIQEKQYTPWKDEFRVGKTIDYYYSKEVKNYVKKVSKNPDGVIEEVEELLDFGKKEVPINNGNEDENKSNGDEAEPFFSLNNRYFQLLLGVVFLIIVIAIIGSVAYKMRKTSLDQKIYEPKKKKKPKKSNKSVAKKKRNKK